MVPRTWIEAESLIAEGHGSAWQVKESTECGNNKYVQFEPGKLRVYPFAQADSTHYLVADFDVDEDATYYIFMRVNTESATAPKNDDTFYFLMDDEDVALYNDGFDNPDHTWVWMNPYAGGKELTAGHHQLKIVGCENGFQLDRICVSRTEDMPQGMGAATGIKEIKTAWHQDGSDNVYDMTGRIVSRNANKESLPRGIYIFRGKKILIK